MSRLSEVLEHRTGSYLLPFFWMKGEGREAVRRELDAVEACGVKEICLESRPHPDFCGPGWWESLDFIFEEVKRRGMRVWILDDRKFPTGYANGGFERRPELAKWYLKERHVDVLGPCRENAVLAEPFLGQDGKLLAVVACPKPDGETAGVSGEGMIDLTAQYRNGFVTFSLPPGPYRLFVFFVSQKHGGREHYMNLIDRRSVRVLLDEVYEKHWQHYAPLFGRELAGFFSDEPELGNAPGYPFRLTLGTPEISLPWSGELGGLLREAWGDDFAENLPALWCGCGERTAAVRSRYMDCVTRLVHECFSGQVGDWCRAHGAEYIGHVLEDDNSHARLGCGTGHYFREMLGQDMAGVDVVHYEIVPGFTRPVHQWVAGDRDGEFFHFGLAKLAGSAAHLDPKKQGRALCELFGNYGWAETVPFMKWLADHMLVRGINRFTPHAFSMTYPDPDCPPHFFAQGNNPQYPAFAQLMRYMNRACHLLSGGTHEAEAAVLYHAEAEWAGGEAMLFQKPVRELMEHMMDCDVIPADSFAQARAEHGSLAAGTERYPCLILPACAHLPCAAAEWIVRNRAAGVPVYAVEPVPQLDTDGRRLPEEFFRAVRPVPLGKLAQTVRSGIRPGLSAEPESPDLRSLRVRQQGGLACMFFNENPRERMETVIHVQGGFVNAVRADLWEDSAVRVPIADGAFRLVLEPGESAFFWLGTAQDAAEGPALPLRLPAGRELRPLENGWKLSRRAAGSETWESLPALAPGQYPDLCGPEGDPHFSGVFRYEGTVVLPEGKGRRLLRVPAAGDTVRVIWNGADLGFLPQQPGEKDVTAAARPGENTVAIEVANTLVRRLRDGVSAFYQIAPSGLSQAPELVLESESKA